MQLLFFKQGLIPIAESGATCTNDGYKAHYKCSCGKYFEDASASAEITDIATWKAGAGKIAAEGHKYTGVIKDAAHLKSEATKCTEYDVYWYDCLVCGTNAKDDPNAADKYYTSTDAGDHKFDKKVTDDAHLVAGTGANCQDVKEYYYDCAHCATIGTPTWASTEVGDHEFDTAQWGYKDKATGHAHKCKYCNEHDAVQPHTPNMDAPTEEDDKICTACQLVLETATGHICKSHLTKVAANGASCTQDGNIEYYECSCGKYYTDSTASVEITDKDSVVIKAGHNYGTLVEEVPAKHTTTELKAGMKAHYFCDKCSTYFTAEKVATTESDLVIPAPVHEYSAVNGYKEADGHANTCSCGAHDTVAGHIPNIPAATETEDQECSICDYVMATATGKSAYLVTVVGSYASITGGGKYETGETVIVYAGSRSGYSFNGWTSSDVTITNANSATASFVMPDYAVTVTANWAKNGSGGGGYVPVTYTNTVASTKNGTVSVDPKSAAKGETVTVTVAPDKGYTLETLTVTDKNGKEIELTNKGDGKYTFKMPASQVTVKATFMDDNTMLNFFVDVPADAYYYDAVLWTVKEGITNGTSAATFSPDNPCTRAQMATFLWRAAGSPEPVSKVCIFTDVPADAYYVKAVQWAYEQGITAGTSATTYSPDKACTRSQMATFLCRMVDGKPVNDTIIFADIKADKYYAKAVQWAYEQKITAGTSTTTFSSDDPCTRAQMVTFLYRYFVK